MSERQSAEESSRSLKVVLIDQIRCCCMLSRKPGNQKIPIPPDVSSRVRMLATSKNQMPPSLKSRRNLVLALQEALQLSLAQARIAGIWLMPLTL